jgi:hypothetical protein
MSRRSLLSSTFGVPEGGVSRLGRCDDRKTGRPALEQPVDLSVGRLPGSCSGRVYRGLEGALMGKSFDEEVGGLTELANGPQGNTPYFWQGPKCPTGSCAS